MYIFGWSPLFRLLNFVSHIKFKGIPHCLWRKIKRQFLKTFILILFV